MFASASLTGAKKFIHFIDSLGREKKNYIYQINTNGHQVFSFAENHKANPKELTEGIAQLAIKELDVTEEDATALAQEALHKDYLAVDEVQIKGPILPSMIKHIDTMIIK